MLRTYLLMLLLGAMLVSCNPARYMAQDLDPRSMSELTIFEPATSIAIISKGNRGEYNPFLSEKASMQVWRGSLDYLSNHYLVHDIYPDSLSHEYVTHEIWQLMDMAARAKRITDVPFPPTIDSMMWVSQTDYAVCLMHRGFSREQGNYGRQVAKGVLLGIVTLGSYYTVPIKAISELSVCVLDRRNQRIVYYDRSYTQDVDPLEKEFTDIQIERVFRKFFKRVR